VIARAAWRLASAIVLVGAVLVGLIAARTWPTHRDLDAGNALQPLGDDAAWIYRDSGSQLDIDPTIPFVIGIVGRETIDGEPAWLLGTQVGYSSSGRLVLVERGGDVWAIAADAIENGRWKRSTFRSAQLFQPAPGPRTWTTDYSDGPPPWKFTGDWEQKATGRVTVIGRTADAWLVTGDLLYEGTPIREIDTFVEGVGLASIVSIGEGYAGRLDLVDLRMTAGPVTGAFVSVGNDYTYDLMVGADATTLKIGAEPAQAISDWRQAGSALSFTAGNGARQAVWSGQVGAAGLLGRITRADGSTTVLDFVRRVTDDEPSPSDSGRP
jgi:hypothetical protein